MWFYRRMMSISWTARKTKYAILKEANTQMRILTQIRKRQPRTHHEKRWFGVGNNGKDQREKMPYSMAWNKNNDTDTQDERIVKRYDHQS